MTGPLAVPCRGRAVRVTVSGPFEHRCPYVDEVDRGTITISWTTVDTTLEAHALRAYLDGYLEVAVSNERVVREIRNDLVVDGIRDVAVSLTSPVAGFDLTASVP